MKKVYLVKSKLFSERKKDSNFHHKIITFTLSLFVIIASFTISSLAATEWTGNTSSDWGESTNWNGTPPGPSTTDVDILIKSGLSTYPVLSSGTYSIKGLSIESGATLTQSGGTLTVNDDFTLSSGSPGGVYNQSGGTLQLKKSFKNDGAFNSTGGTVQFSAGANSGNFDGTNQFFHLTIDASVIPNFDGGSYNISVAGNYLNNNSSLDITTAVFTFNGTSDQTISSTSTPLPATTTFGNLVIDKPSGTIQLLSDVAVENTFTETNGTLDENGYVLWVNGSPLPVELSSFSAVILENRIKLKWRTETEVSNYGFEIERTLSDSQNLIWGKIGFVEGHGNSNSPKEYNFIDSEVKSAGTYSYRLKQIDNDGTYEYSDEIEIEIIPVEFALYQNYPNPFNPTTKIRYQLPKESKVIIKIYDILGSEVITLLNEQKEPGVYEVEFNASHLSSGTYIYRIVADGPSTSSGQSFVETKKMVLMK